MWTVVVRDSQGREVKRLPLNGRLIVGRTSECQIMLDAPAVSRQHARIEMFKDKPVFVDLGSSNGSLLNGQAVTKPLLIDERHQIEIGGFRLSFEKPGVTATTAPPSPAPTAVSGLSVDDLVPMMAPARPVAPASSPAPASLQATQFTVSARESAPAPPKEVNWNSATDVFEQQLKGIRAHREETQRGAEGRLQQLETEWNEIVVTIRQLQAKLNGNPKVLHFVVSRDQKEVSIKIADESEKRGYRYFIFSRHHPEGQYPGLDAVWLREFGVDDVSYKEPKKAMQELVQRIAGTLA